MKNKTKKEERNVGEEEEGIALLYVYTRIVIIRYYYYNRQRKPYTGRVFAHRPAAAVAPPVGLRLSNQNRGSLSVAPTRHCPGPFSMPLSPPRSPHRTLPSPLHTHTRARARVPPSSDARRRRTHAARPHALCTAVGFTRSRLTIRRRPAAPTRPYGGTIII